MNAQVPTNFTSMELFRPFHEIETRNELNIACLLTYDTSR